MQHHLYQHVEEQNLREAAVAVRRHVNLSVMSGLSMVPLEAVTFAAFLERGCLSSDKGGSTIASGVGLACMKSASKSDDAKTAKSPLEGMLPKRRNKLAACVPGLGRSNPC